jgi:hypothetical protein
MTIKLNEYLLNWMNIAIKLNKYINIEYCNNRRAIGRLLWEIAVLSGYITTWNKQAETWRLEGRPFFKN